METPLYLGNSVQEFYALECELFFFPFFYSSIVLQSLLIAFSRIGHDNGFQLQFNGVEISFWNHSDTALFCQSIYTLYLYRF